MTEVLLSGLLVEHEAFSETQSPTVLSKMCTKGMWKLGFVA